MTRGDNSMDETGKWGWSDGRPWTLDFWIRKASTKDHCLASYGDNHKDKGLWYATGCSSKKRFVCLQREKKPIKNNTIMIYTQENLTSSTFHVLWESEGKISKLAEGNLRI